MKRFGGAAKLSLQDPYQSSASITPLEDGLAAARNALLSTQKEDGHWCFPLEADCTIPAEYVLMMHFMDDVDVDLEVRIARFIREKQDSGHGGWPLYYGGDFDLSCTVKAYYALKIVGDAPDAPHMKRAQSCHPETRRGGAGQCVYADIARHVWADSLARRSICTGGDHTVAAVVSFPPEQDRILVSYRYDTAVHSMQLESTCSKSAQGSYSRIVYRGSRGRAKLFSGAYSP